MFRILQNFAFLIKNWIFEKIAWLFYSFQKMGLKKICQIHSFYATKMVCPQKLGRIKFPAD